MQNNNSFEYQSSQGKREIMLQQIILEQKQKIRDLELQTQKQQTPPMYKQQLLECTNQLEESKNIIKQLLQQKDQLTQKIQTIESEMEVQQSQAVQEIQNQYNQRIKQLQHENQLLQEELQQFQPLSKALNNYTQEEKYIQQINILYDFLTQWQKQNMSELVYYKRELEIQITQKETLNSKHIEEKKELTTQLNQRIKLDQQIQNDVILQLQATLQEISKFQNEIKQFKLFNGNYQKIEESLLQQIENLKPISTIQQVQQIKSNQSQYTTKIENNQQDDQIAYLRSENEQLKQATDDIKSLSLLREKTLKQEIQRNKDKCEYLTQQIESREKHYIQDLQKIKQYIEQIEKNYESRENFYKFNSEELQSLLDNFRNITQQISTELRSRKGNEHIKECKDLLAKLVQSKSKQPKQIKSLEKLETICKDLLKNQQLIKQNEDLKDLIIDVSKQILNSQEYKQQTIILFEALDQLEGIITSPNKRVDDLLDLFHKELQQLTKLREQTYQNNNIYTQILEIIKEKQDSPTVQASNQKEVEHISQLRQLEQEQYKKEIDIAINRSQKLLEVQEMKIKNLEYQIRKQEQYINQQYQSTSSQQTEMDALIKQQNKQIIKLQKQLNEIQQQRVQDKKDLIKLIQDSEAKQIENQNKMLKLIDVKYNTIADIVNKKVNKLIKPEKVQNNEEQSKIIQQDTNSQIKQLIKKDQERDQQYQSQLEQLRQVIDELKNSIQNLHAEKGELIQQLDELNKVVQTQKKVYYSFRQQQQ
ncbi:unnamed protein product (macronuclear) [Paramecium tetraurelia]|uniref:Uncharacterized protein n=1 Tax=Paramecium tetraurelia TaxID=5888 RepID=A0BFV0_PARTE|nr:uncharacterized protein GSPATT00028452001 [Paramecium tetraurelia]CAK57417.1 unnamed protein product [Paramecium tetraurelia]|eukprot:XP_001424815.1 hypothetical protein (macronuclear) [Paramecium tetraurelia strain d4-2]